VTRCRGVAIPGHICSNWVMTSLGLRGEHIYDHLGVRSRRLDDESGETTMPISDEVRVSGGLRSAPLGLAFEQGVANYLYDRVMAVPYQISLHIRDSGDDVKGIRSVTHIVRLGRSLVATDGQIHDVDNPSRLIAYGSIIWSVIGEAPDRTGAAREPIPYQLAGMDVIEATQISPLEDGRGCRLEAITPQTAGPGGILHAGMLQLLAEEAALVTAADTSHADRQRAVDCSYNFLQPGKTGPFVATAELLCRSDEGVDTEVVVRDEGNDNRILSLSYVRVRPVI